jgi:tRNA G26 N,N-dimethylase Trm1
LGLVSAAEVLGGLAGVDGFPPWSFSIEKICSSLRVATVPEAEVCRNLKGLGHRYMRTPFEKTGIKTDAEFSEVVRAVNGAVGALGRR